MLEVEYELPPFGEPAQLTNLPKKKKKKHLEKKKRPALALHIIQNRLRKNSMVI